MQFGGQSKPPVGVVFDCDMASSVDDALALAMLFGFQGKNELRLISLSVSRPSMQAAEYCDAVSHFYLGEPGPFFVNSPVGMSLEGKPASETPMLAAPLARTGAEGKPAFPRTIEKLNDTADPLALIRNALTAQFDQNAEVVLAGPATNLARLLDLPGAREVVAQKVRYLVAAVGAFPDGPADPTIAADVAAAKKLVAGWPTPIVFAGAELGEALPFPAASLDKDFAWSQAHPVVDAYRAAKPMPYDAPASALAAVLYAARPTAEDFQLSPPGVVAVLDDGRVRFTPAAGGKHRYLVADPAKRAGVIQTYTEIASLKPAGRPQRFRPGQQQQKKQAAPPK
jgi:purine nucleosidase